MISAVISRDYQEHQTLGCLYVFDRARALANVRTLELPEKGNQKNVSCIPPGEYHTIKIVDSKGRNCFLLLGVPGRSGIEIHIGNYAAGAHIDTEGCILPGMNFSDINKDGYLDVVDSTTAMILLMRVLPDSFTTYIL